MRVISDSRFRAILKVKPYRPLWKYKDIVLLLFLMFSVNQDSISIFNVLFNFFLFLFLVELAAEEVNYLRLVHLMLRIATPVVRGVFDIEFDPEQLKGGNIFPRYRIEQLVKRRHLSEKEKDLVLSITRKIMLLSGISS